MADKTPKQVGDDVVLQIFSTEEVQTKLTKGGVTTIGTKNVMAGFDEVSGIVIGGTDEALTVAYFSAGRSELLGGADWRNAFDRQIGVKPFYHPAVQAVKEGFAWR